MRHSLLLLAMVAVGAGCSDAGVAPAGSPSDSPPSSDAPQEGAGDARPTNSLPQQPASQCVERQKVCANACVSVEDPAFGCGSTTCGPCPAGLAGTTAICDKRACGVRCEAGFNRRENGCVRAGWLAEPFTLPTAPTTGLAFRGLWGSRADDIYAAGTRTEVGPGGYVRGVANGGAVYHRTATGTWVPLAIPAIDSLQAISGFGSNDIYAVGRGVLHSTAAGVFRRETFDTAGRGGIGQLGSGVDASSLWLSGTGDVYVGLPTSFVVHRTAAGPWTSTAVGSVLNLWGSGPSDLYAGTGEGLAHFDGTTWSRQQSAQPNVLWGSGPNDLYGVKGAMLFRSKGGGVWTNETGAPAIPLHYSKRAMWGTGPDDVYLLTTDDTSSQLHHSKGDGKWSQVLATPKALYAIWGSARDDVYVAGDGTILHGP